MVPPQQHENQKHRYRHDCHTTVTSRVLVTRKPPPVKRSRVGDKEGTDSHNSNSKNSNNKNNNNFWVVGWVSLSPITVTKGDDKNRNDGYNTLRETTVVAGFLPVDRPLIEYQNTIERLKSRANEVVGSDNVMGSTCLTDSLQILAYWTSTTSTNDKERSFVTTTDRSDDDTSDLPILNNQRGYPWWYEQDEVVPSINQVSPSASLTQYNQVLFYELQDDNVEYEFEQGRVGRRISLDHYESGFSSNGTDWPLMIHRINHSNEILRIVQTGRVPERRYEMGQPIITSEKLIEESGPNRASTESIETHSQGGVPSEISTSIVHRIQHLVVNNTLTILHFRHLYSISSSTARTNTARWRFHILSCLSFYRFCVAIHELSTFTTNSQSYICTNRNKPCLIPSRGILVKQRAARWDALLCTTIDMVLGFLLCGTLLLLCWHVKTIGIIHLAGKIRIFETLKGQIGWLETFPAGFKLNVQLTHNMGYEIQSLLRQQERVLLATLWNPIFFQQYGIPSLAVLAAGCGWTTILAVVIDLWRLENFHLTVLTTAFRRLYSVELYLLSGLFRLFRGKKRNPLRQRTDTMHYDAVQLLVGTVGFCICIFLWTTVMVYYTFFVFWNLAMHLPVVFLWSLYSLSLSLPWGSLLLRCVHPGWFPKDVYIEFLGRDSFTESPSSSSSNHGKAECNTINQVVQISELVSISESVVHIVGNPIAVHLKSIFKWYLDASIEVLFPRSGNSSPTTIPLAQLVNNLVPWEKPEATTATTGIGNGNVDPLVQVEKSKSD